MRCSALLEMVALGDCRAQFGSLRSRTPRAALTCVAVSSTAQLQAKPFVRGAKVKLVDDIPGYPAGSTGKIAVANGFAWTRYWVRFDDGRAVGHVDHHSLVKRGDYDDFLAARTREELEAVEAAEQAAKATAEAPDPAEAAAVGAGASGGAVQVNGVTIPQRLLDMSAAARQRLGA